VVGGDRPGDGYVHGGDPIGKRTNTTGW
jgi:hypothetical protein